MVDYLAFVALAAVLVAVPGPAVVLVSTYAARHGARAAAATGIGVFVADLVWVAATVLGLTAVLVASEPAFLAIRYVGAGYLVYLGLRLLLSRRTDVEVHARAASGVGAARAFRQGVLCDLSNPKTLLVFTSVVPQFLDTDSSPAHAALLGVTFAAVGLVSLFVYGAVVLGARRSLVPRRRLGDLLTRASGGVLVLFGVGLVVESP